MNFLKKIEIIPGTKFILSLPSKAIESIKKIGQSKESIIKLSVLP